MSLKTTARHAQPGRAGRRRLLALGVVPVVLAGGTAYAYWSAMGSGTAEISAATAAPLVVSSQAVPVGGLFPGKTSDLGFVLANSNGYPVSLTKLTAVSVASNDEADCPAATSITLPAEVTDDVAAGGYLLPDAFAVPAGSTSTAATLPDLITMAPSAPDGCQGVTFTVSLSFSGTQV